MKSAILKNLITVFVFAAATGSANAYYLENAIPGKVTVEVTGACAIPATTVNAYLADIQDDERTPIGRGIVTVSGKLIALQEKTGDVRYLHVYATNEKSATDYIDVVGATLRSFLTTNGVHCNIDTLEPDVNSKAVYRTTVDGGSVNLKANFGGHEQIRCFDQTDQERCLAQKIRGVIRFKGAWQSANT